MSPACAAGSSMSMVATVAGRCSSCAWPRAAAMRARLTRRGPRSSSSASRGTSPWGPRGTRSGSSRATPSTSPPTCRTPIARVPAASRCAASAFPPSACADAPAWPPSPQRPEAGADLLHEQLGLLEGGEVAALRRLAPVADVLVAPGGPAARRSVDLLGEDRAPGGDLDSVLGPLIEPFRDRGEALPVQR